MSTGTPREADALVVFGITGDLAKKMTFRSLYRLEQRGLLDVPVIGVAVDDWSIDKLRQHALDSIEACGETLEESVCDAFCARLSYVQGNFDDAGTYTRLSEALKGLGVGVPDASTSRSRRHCSRWWSPVSPRPGSSSHGERVVVEKPFGHDLAVGPGTGGRPAQVHRRAAALQDRPLPREDGARGDPLPAVRQLDARAGVEPQPPRLRPDHDRRGIRRRGPRATSTTRSGRYATSSSTICCSCSRRRRWSRPRAATPTRSRTPSRPCSARWTMPTLPATSAASTTATSKIDGRRAGLDDRDVRGAAAADRELALGGRPLVHPHRQAAPRDRDRAATDLQASPAGPLHQDGPAPPRAEPDRVQDRSRNRDPDAARRSPRRSVRTGRDRARHGVRRKRAARAIPPTRCCCTPRSSATAPTSPARTWSRRRWRIVQPLLDHPPEVMPYAPGSWGPKEADKLVAGFGGWHGPWMPGEPRRSDYGRLPSA